MNTQNNLIKALSSHVSAMPTLRKSRLMIGLTIHAVGFGMILSQLAGKALYYGQLLAHT